MRGSVSVHSGADGTGTLVAVDLPAAP
jgi:hypothetical protein